MKRVLTKILLAALLTPIAESALAMETYILDPTHTAVVWHISHFGFSNPSGKWMASGTLVLDQAHPANSAVNVTIPLSNLVTGVPALDQHLKSKDFFNIQQYPIATFVSNKVDVTGVDTAKVYGTLTLHGVSKPEVLDVKLNRQGMSSITHKQTVGFTATAEVNRSDFNIMMGLPGLSNKVILDIDAEATMG